MTSMQCGTRDWLATLASRGAAVELVESRRKAAKSQSRKFGKTTNDIERRLTQPRERVKLPA